jgi:hypothetical protein
MTDLIEDTGSRRRAADRVSTDESLELISSLAMAHALSNDDVDVVVVEEAILNLRQLKIEETGTFRTSRLTTQ